MDSNELGDSTSYKAMKAVDYSTPKLGATSNLMRLSSMSLSASDGALKFHQSAKIPACCLQVVTAWLPFVEHSTDDATTCSETLRGILGLCR